MSFKRFVTKGHVCTTSPSVGEYLCWYNRQIVAKTTASDEDHYSDQSVPHGQVRQWMPRQKGWGQNLPGTSQWGTIFQEQGISEGADRQSLSSPIKNQCKILLCMDSNSSTQVSKNSKQVAITS